jgi:mRNA interferase HicA
LQELGWWFSHHGGEHDRWTNGKEQESVPRHKEIGEYLAKKILKKAKDFPLIHEE